MQNGPDYKETLSEGVMKDINIENLQRELEQLRNDSGHWMPDIVIDQYKSGDDFKVQFKLTLDGKVITVALTKSEVLYYSGDIQSLVRQILVSLADLYVDNLMKVYGGRLTATLENIKKYSKDL